MPSRRLTAPKRAQQAGLSVPTHGHALALPHARLYPTTVLIGAGVTRLPPSPTNTPGASSFMMPVISSDMRTARLYFELVDTDDSLEEETSPCPIS